MYDEEGGHIRRKSGSGFYKAQLLHVQHINNHFEVYIMCNFTQKLNAKNETIPAMAWWTRTTRCSDALKQNTMFLRFKAILRWTKTEIWHLFRHKVCFLIHPLKICLSTQAWQTMALWDSTYRNLTRLQNLLSESRVKHANTGQLYRWYTVNYKSNCTVCTVTELHVQISVKKIQQSTLVHTMYGQVQAYRQFPPKHFPDPQLFLIGHIPMHPQQRLSAAIWKQN